MALGLSEGGVLKHIRHGFAESAYRYGEMERSFKTLKAECIRVETPLSW
jgi:hypothetical protein